MNFSEAASSMNLFSLVPLVVLLPLLGLLINIIFGNRLPEKAIGVIASAATTLAFAVAVLQAVALTNHPEGVVVPFLDWISISVPGLEEGLNIPWAFQVDTLSVTMMMVVAGVGALIHIYSIGYMHEDVRLNADPTRYKRFFVFLNLFIVAMMILVSSDNYLMLFVGWEGVGLCSYLLIGFWFEKGKDGIGNSLAAKKAFVTNRIGDFGFLIAAFIMFGAFKSFNFHEVFELAPEVAAAMPGVILAITIFMLLGVTGKSAQLPLYVWLPDAMAGPTPVSALIHAATMVTAGVYLIARSHALYVLVPQAQNMVALVGGATALFAATIAVGQFDIKKVLAYSTISQLGFMVAAVGMGAFVAGMFHLVTHAFFKALLFLSAGSVIQGVEHGHHYIEHHGTSKQKHRLGPAFDPQDMRNMGGLRHAMPTTFWVYFVGALALAGIPPLAGFFSKDEILAEAFELNRGVYILLTVAAFFTAFYVGRQVILVFFGQSRSEAAGHAKENPPVMVVPLVILAVLAAIGGGLNLPGLHTFTGWLEHTLEEVHTGAFNPLVAVVSTILALIALIFAWWLYSKRFAQLQALPPAKRPDDPLRQLIGPIFSGMENKWWIDELYWAIVVNPYVAIARFLAEKVDSNFWHDWFHDVVIAGVYQKLTHFLAVPFDLGVIDAIANGLGNGTQALAASLRRLQTGFVRNYALSIFLGVVVIIGYLMIRSF